MARSQWRPQELGTAQFPAPGSPSLSREHQRDSETLVLAPGLPPALTVSQSSLLLGLSLFICTVTAWPL